MDHSKSLASVLAVFLIVGCSSPAPSSDSEPAVAEGGVKQETQVSLKVSGVQGDAKHLDERVDGNKPGAPIKITIWTENAESVRIVPAWQEEPIDLTPVVPGPTGPQVWEATFIAPAEPGEYRYRPEVYEAGGQSYVSWAGRFELVADGHEAGWVDVTAWPKYDEDWPAPKMFDNKENLAREAVAAIFAEGGPNRLALAELRCPNVSTRTYMQKLDADSQTLGLLNQPKVVSGVKIDNIFTLPLPGEERAEHWDLGEDPVHGYPLAHYEFVYSVDAEVVRSVLISLSIASPPPDEADDQASGGWCLTGSSYWVPSEEDITWWTDYEEDWVYLQ